MSTNLKEATPPVANGELKRETVYIVEDDASTRDALEELIRPTGANVESFNSAEAFLSNFDCQQPSCLLVDQKLPGISGCELLRQLHGAGVPIPAVLVTAYATTPITVEAMRMGAVDVLEKPCGDHVIRNAIEQAIQVCRSQTPKPPSLRNAARHIEQLSASESTVLVEVLEGVPNKQIARQLGVCIRTVEARRSRIYKTMGVKSVAELTRACVAAGFIDT